MLSLMHCLMSTNSCGTQKILGGDKNPKKRFARELPNTQAQKTQKKDLGTSNPLKGQAFLLLYLRLAVQYFPSKVCYANYIPTPMKKLLIQPGCWCPS